MHKVIAAWAFPFPIFGLTGDQSPLNASNHKQNQKIGNLHRVCKLNMVHFHIHMIMTIIMNKYALYSNIFILLQKIFYIIKSTSSCFP